MIQRTSRNGGRFSSPSSADQPSIDDLDILDERHLEIVEDAIAEGRIGYAIQSIHAIGDPDQILYCECLPCLIEKDGTEHVNGGFVPALEVLGEAPVLDRYMLRLVLDALETDPLAVLGCRLSSDNLSSSETWSHIRDQIAARSALAPRLILDIDASSPFADAALARDLLSEVRAFGCRIVLAGSGCGRSLGLDADIVKIDAQLASTLCDPDQRETGSHLVKLGARVVMIEGMESVEELKAARSAGATHVRGNLRSKPVFPLLGAGGRP